MEVTTIIKKQVKISDSDIRKAIIGLLYEANEIQSVGEINPESINFHPEFDPMDEEYISSVTASLEITKAHS